MASVNLFLDKSRTNRQGLHPCTLRLTHLRRQWMITIGVYCTSKDYDKALGNGNINEKQKQLREQLMEKKKKADDVLNSLSVVTIDNFKRMFLSDIDVVRSKDMLPLRSCMEAHILSLKEEGRINTAEAFRNALRTLLLYRPDRNLQEIDSAYLRGYENYITENGGSISTASIYLRCLKRLFNKHIKDKTLNRKYYPFDEHVCRSTRSTKNVLFPKDIEKFLEWEPTSDAQKKAKDFWFFSFLCNGMNPRDVFDLKKKDISDDRLTYTRHKTAKRYSEPVQVVLYLHPMAKEIIKRQGNKKGEYVFPLFNGTATELERYQLLHDWKRHTNRCLNRVAKSLGLPQMNMGIARHSFGTAMALKNTHVSIISKMLGHTKIETTQKYLAGLPDEAMKELSYGLLDFKPKTHLKAV